MAKKETFSEATLHWDLETLYKDLASAKGKHLTPTEKLHLRGLLCEYSPDEIADKLDKSAKAVGVDLCNTLYRYVKILVEPSNGKVDNWRNIYEWLDTAGYKSDVPLEAESDDYLSAKILIKKANFKVDKNQIIVDVNLRIVATSPTELSTIKVEDEEE